MSNSVETLTQFAVACHYNQHGYLKVEAGNLVATSEKNSSSLKKVVSHAIGMLKDPQSKPLVAESLRLIKAHLQEKCSGWIARIFYSARVKEIQTEISRITRAIRHMPEQPREDVFRLKLLASLPKELGVSEAPNANHESTFHWRTGAPTTRNVNEWKVVEWLSKNVFASNAVTTAADAWKTYREIMLGAYQGDHLLIEDVADHARSKELYEHGAIIRGSSHYENGRKINAWDEQGQPEYASDHRADLEAAEVHHYGITGKHIKHILFHPVDMREQQNGSLIVGKTARQVDKLLAANNLSIDGQKIAKKDVKDLTRQYVAFQFESSQDSEGNNLLDPHFYTHRLMGCITYRARKMLNFAKANVGAYGYGFTDQHPVVLQKPVAK